MPRVALLLTLLSLAVFAVHPGPVRVEAASATGFHLLAAFSGWNVTSGGPTNPTIIEFRGEPFTAGIEFDDSPGISHNFAVYTKGFAAGSVTPSNICSLTNAVGCLAKSATVTATSPLTSFTFTPTIPPDDFSGPGGYEYYCQFHGFSMHGKLTVDKSPDLNADGTVTILDIAAMAFAFETAPGDPTWNIAADLDNSGRVNILDIALAAFYFGDTV